MKAFAPALLMVCVAGGLNGSAAEIAASGLSFPFFDQAGKLTHKVMARHGTVVNGTQNLNAIEIEYYANGDPKRIVQRISAKEATWDEKRETLVGTGAVTVQTETNRLAGEGFRFELARSQLNIHRNFSMENREVRVTSDRAVVDLLLEREADEVKLRDVKRCEAIGNLVVKVQPTASKKYNYEEARSTRAIYDGPTHTVTLPEETRAVQNGYPSVVQHLDYKLDPDTRPALKLKP